jgi:hypothetical protein
MKDEVAKMGFNGFPVQHRSNENAPEWKYEIADWIMSPSWGFLIDHHMRITNRLVDVNSQRWYQILDTTLTRGEADYEWVVADAIEKNSRLVQRPDPRVVPAILQRTAQCKGLKYSIPERLDCESLQRWIHTGQEQYRWCPQVWTLVATLVGSVVIAAFQTKPKPKRRRAYRRH